MNNPRVIETIVEGATYKIPTYKVTENGIEDGEGIEIKFCKGNKENPDTLRQEGMFTESLLQVGLQYLQSVNVGELASRDTSLAITHLEDALFRIGKRAEDRKLRGVQATYNKIAMDGKIKLDVFGKVIDINPEAYIVTLEKISDDCVSKVHTGQGGNVFTIPIFTVKDYGVTADEFIKEFNTQNSCAWADSQGFSKRQLKPSDVEFTIIDSTVYKITEKGILYMENNPPKDSATSLLSRAELGKNHIQSQSLVDEIEFLLKNELIEPVK